jgi:hypothetical protein
VSKEAGGAHREHAEFFVELAERGSRNCGGLIRRGGWSVSNRRTTTCGRPCRGRCLRVAYCLEGLAAIAASENRLVWAARLWGAAEALLETIEITAPLCTRPLP